MVLTQWFNLGLSVSVVKKLVSISPFVTKVLFVTLILILSNSLCLITWFKLVFWEIPLCKYCLIYMCALFRPFFCVYFHHKRILFKKTRFYVCETWLQGNFNLCQDKVIITTFRHDIYPDIFTKIYVLPVERICF